MNVKIRCSALIVIQVFLAYNRSTTLGAEDQGESQMEKGTVMLSIFFGDMPEAIYNPVIYFKNTYTDEWITDELSKKMIKDIDKLRRQLCQMDFENR